MKKGEYSSHFKDPRWQQFRLRVFERDGFKCRLCESGSKQLNAHHDYYIAKRMPWQYPLGCVKTLCEDCHKETHESSIEDSDNNEWEEWEYVIDISLNSLAGESIGVSILCYSEMTMECKSNELVDAIVHGLDKQDPAFTELLSRFRESKMWRNNKELYT